MKKFFINRVEELALRDASNSHDSEKSLPYHYHIHLMTEALKATDTNPDRAKDEIKENAEHELFLAHVRQNGGFDVKDLIRVIDDHLSHAKRVNVNKCRGFATSAYTRNPEVRRSAIEILETETSFKDHFAKLAKLREKLRKVDAGQLKPYTLSKADVNRIQFIGFMKHYALFTILKSRDYLTAINYIKEKVAEKVKHDSLTNFKNIN